MNNFKSINTYRVATKSGKVRKNDKIQKSEKNVRKSQETWCKHALNNKVYYHYKLHFVNVIFKKKLAFVIHFFQGLIEFF